MPSGGAGTGDPLSHLLLRPGGMQMERDTPPIPAPPTAAAGQQPGSAARFDFSGNPPSAARTLPPPAAAEPAVGAATGDGGWGGDGAPGISRVGGRDGLGEDNVSVSFSFPLRRETPIRVVAFRI